LWAGTSVGLFRTEGDRLVEETSPRVERPVYFIVRDRAGRIWFGTDNGVVRWDGQNLESFTVREGLVGRETNRAAGMMDSQGLLWFGTEQGVTVYNDRLPAPIRAPPFLELVAIEVSGRRLPPDQPLRLDFSDNDLAFHYRIVSLVDETRIRIRYQLEGLEDRRVALSGVSQEVRYPNLEPGEYRFRIAGGSFEDRWAAEEMTAPIVILRPISQRPWFFLVVAGLLALGVYSIQSFFAQRRYSRRLEAEVAQRLKELNASEERYRRIFERNRAAMLILDGDDLAIADANRAACVFYGYRLEELKGLTHEDLLVVDEPESLEQLSLESRTHLMAERHRLKNGEVRDVETYASAILVEGRATLFVIIHDVTERRLVEESMLIEKERLAITLRHIDDGVITMGRQGEILLLNRKAEEIAEWSSSEVVGQPLGGVLQLHEMGAGGRLGRRLSLPWEEPAENSSRSVFKSVPEAILRLRGGKQRLLELSGSPIKQLSGEVSGWVLAFRDITEKKKIEEELVRAQKMEALGILAGGIAHDFNNLLTVLLGNLSLLSSGADLGPREVRNLENAETAVMRARDLAQQLLTFSSGGAPLREAASMGEVIQESVGFVLRGSAVRAEIEMAEDLWVVEIDPGQINQVLNNLLINAMQAMPSGGIVKIRGENLEHPPATLPPCRHIAIHIIDQGKGIDEEHLDRIFDPYFTTKAGGRGLGLTSAYSIVKQHEGLLTVHSELGVGTTFSIHLPATKSPLEKASTDPEIVDKGAGRILVMDDDDGVRLVLESIVENLGYQPVATVDGEQTIACYRESLAENRPFDAVIMDLTIPGGMGGQEALEHLLVLDPGVRAIVVSGYSNNPVLAHYRDYGFKGRVSKPFRAQELGIVLSQVLGDQEESRKAEEAGEGKTG
jgi:PAS domain S-box-containing protein